MNLDKQIKMAISEFKKEAGIEDSIDNMRAFLDLENKIYMMIPEEEDHTGECYCNCDFCENCSYN